jgi:NADPH:quinone reductase-like Zn-dependent oxidoreductase
MMAAKPHRIGHLEAASVPVVAVTAWQMLFDYANAKANQTVLILGAAGNVGAYAVQLAVRTGLHVIAVVGSKDIAFVRSLGSEKVVDSQNDRFEDTVHSVDLVIDTVGSEARARAINIIKPGGTLVSSAGGPLPKRSDVRSIFFYVEVTSKRLNAISQLLDRGELIPQVGTVLPLEDVRSAHEMLEGAPHKRGKIILQVVNAK